jgi:hypothetical protein
LIPASRGGQRLENISPDGWPFGEQPFVEKHSRLWPMEFAGEPARQNSPLRFKVCRVRSLICSCKK